MDYFLFSQINQLALKYFWLDLLAIFFASYFEYVLIFFLLLFLIKSFKKYWPMVIYGFVAGIFARFLIVELIRWFWPRPRPFVENNVNMLLNYNPSLASFPSGHAAFYFAIAAVVYFYNKKVGLLFILASFLISFARIFAGIHWPSDIIVGSLFGIISGWLICKIFKKNIN